MSPLPHATLALVALFALAGTCRSSPLPPSGQFAYPGGPTLPSGLWINADPSRPALTSFTEAGFVAQRLLTNGSVSTVLTRASSFQCIDDNTWKVIYEGYSYTDLPARVLPYNLCSVRRLVGNVLTFTNYPLESGICPDVDALPGFNFTLIPSTENIIASATFVRLAQAGT